MGNTNVSEEDDNVYVGSDKSRKLFTRSALPTAEDIRRNVAVGQTLTQYLRSIK